MPAGPEEGLEKSATLLIALGEDHAAEVLKLLGPREGYYKVSFVGQTVYGQLITADRVRTVSIALTLALTAMPWPLIPIGAAVVIGGWLWTRPEA